MKAIIALLVMILLGGGGMAPMASEGAAGFVNRYVPINDTTIEIERDPPGEDLVVNGENPWVSRVFEVDEVWPGDSGAATLTLQNIGGPGRLYLHFLDLVDEPGITPEPEPTPDNGELSQNLDMLIWWDDNNNGVYEPPGETLVVEDTLKNIACNIYDLGTLDYMEMKYLGIAWSVDDSVGNEIMGDECTFDIEFQIH